MFSLVKKILNGFTNTTSTESIGEKEEKMYNIKTNVPEIDQENMALLTASTILEGIGNEPNPTANEFYAQLVVSDIPKDQHEEIILAAISIETMMNLDIFDEDFIEPTIH